MNESEAAEWLVSDSGSGRMMQSVPHRSIAFLAGVFVVCASGLMLQIVETRVFSVLSWYHLAFFAVSMAMLGMTAGSLFVYFRPHMFPSDRLQQNLGWISAALAISIVVSTLGLITSVVPSGITNTLVMTAVVWLRMMLIMLPPYVFLGMAVSLALTRSPWPVGLVYGVDLTGAATGCLIVLVLLEWADGVSALFAIAAIAAAGAACFAAAAHASGEVARRTNWITNLGSQRRTIILTIALAALAIGNAVSQPHGLALLMSKSHLELSPPFYIRWNTFSRIQVMDSGLVSPQLWGPSTVVKLPRIQQRLLEIDGNAATAMYKFDGDFSKLDFLRYDITNLAYTIRHDGRSAVIGVGGGRDLLAACLYGFHDVTGVELNPIFVDLLTRKMRDFNHLADVPGVRLIVDDARSWFARTPERFDLLQMSLVDTWASTGAGAYSLSENGLYTLQGWRHFLTALTPTGMFTVSRWFNPNDVSEIGRLLSLAAAALRDQGIADPGKHMFIAATENLATLIVAKSAFTADELTRLHARVDELQFRMLYSPDQTAGLAVVRQIIEAPDAAALSALSRQQHLDFSVTTDARPFFFNQLIAFDPASIRLALRNDDGIVRGNLMASLTIVVIMVLSGLLVLFAMIVPALPSVRDISVRLTVLGTGFFFLIGLGFMFVEVGVIQRVSTFLGHPVYGLAIGLFGLILSTGVGSFISERFPLRSVPRLLLWVVLIGCYVASLPFWFPVLVERFEGADLIRRVFVALAAIVPSGLLMGYGFPTGMRLINRIDPRPTPWFWAVNGAAGVLATSVAVATSITFSIDVSLWVGATCYLLIGPFGSGLIVLSRRFA